MSTEFDAPPSKEKKDIKHPDKGNMSEKKSSKKRRHEEASSELPNINSPDPQSRKRRKHHGNEDYPDQTYQMRETSQTLVGSPLKNSHGTTSPAMNGARTKLYRNQSAAELNGENRGPLFSQSCSFYVQLSSICQSKPLEGVCAEHISPLLLTYYQPLEGIILAYENPRLSEAPVNGDGQQLILAKVVDEYAVSFMWITADFVFFTPSKGMWLDAQVNLQNESHIGLIVWNLFSASIERSRIPKDWKWREEWEDQSGYNGDGHDYQNAAEGYWVDGHGDPVEGQLTFRICDFETINEGGERGIMAISGTLLGEEEEEKLQAEEKRAYDRIRYHARPGRRAIPPAATGGG
ncbi:hypothetical protein K402DRAFT_394554 [Aulographum hederae CBS 113979]|uniref:DNA-directed RNA polymerase subunit n=1 Tax=Aulographum hederae CBS 113979 TaxID=1176131 RepID=A0A6G1GX92_9PEZI|nr:hypothetical protein K402DRAFT_394554 [Aulographum hederae CBS 113979]